MTDTDAALERLMVKAAHLQDELAQICCHATAADGQVQVTVDVAGAIVELSLAATLYGTDLGDLAAAITAAHTAAHAEAAQIATDLQRELRDDPYTAAIATRLAAAGRQTPPQPAYDDSCRAQANESAW
ncbi:YbaB/EbfC family nucleoid-associated protein [Nocardia arthritidis]|uniref:YbaB/EbfC family DNA-binding protein n=1 Tax=Nocardia arthritidis TaxID=228602 RepID=A0A6G9YC73_9NOCA|nr:YbaB/EbfC family nucleoid-associated protein [Nocardia arthritidis]QIS10613.1 hypothetical protein F5544_13625 [Nocardia arthritidis]